MSPMDPNKPVWSADFENCYTDGGLTSLEACRVSYWQLLKPDENGMVDCKYDLAAAYCYGNGKHCSSSNRYGDGPLAMNLSALSYVPF